MNMLDLMHCDQCEQAKIKTGCTTRGVCDKDPDVESLQKFLLYGLKGLAAYKEHARRLGKTNYKVEEFIEKALFSTMTNVNFDFKEMFELVLECGKMNLLTMELLNNAHVENFGNPEIGTVKEGIQDGPGILISGHDLLDLKKLLEQTENLGIKIYTNGEMLPAHMYPELKKYSHLAGNYGGAWQNQRIDFQNFNGPILVTTNCVQIPRKQNTYLERLFTSRVTAVPGAIVIKNNDFSVIIKKAQEIGNLKATKIKISNAGFHYSVILSLSDKIVKAVKNGDIKHFLLVGGCDGNEPSREYFAEVAQNAPENAIILTLGCGKYRIRDYDYGTIAGIPRLLDLGQCNDSYGAIQIAISLSKIFNCGINDLPLTMFISWFEQKAIAVLLTLLHLGVKGIRLGPNLPVFMTPKVLNLLQEKFNLKTIGKSGKQDISELFS